MTVLPHPRLKREYVGRYVRTKRDMSNGFVTIPAGMIGLIDAQSPKGSILTFSPCKCCGMTAHVSRVQPTDFEFIEQV